MPPNKSSLENPPVPIGQKGPQFRLRTSPRTHITIMSNELLAGIQIISVLTYVGVAIALYRILVQQKDANKFVVAGDLTLRGITHKVQVPLTFNGVVTTRMGVAAGFSGYLTLKLSDFGVPFTREFEPGRRVVGDELKVELQIEAKPRQ